MSVTRQSYSYSDYKYCFTLKTFNELKQYINIMTVELKVT